MRRKLLGDFNTSGFTLIELLIVIAIIGLLAAFALISLQAGPKKARDAQRKSDLNQYRALLANYASNNKGFYPSTAQSTNPVSTNLCGYLGLTGSSCINDPKSTYPYYFGSDGTNLGQPEATTYILWAKLESVTPTNYWIVCSNGKSGASTAQPTIADVADVSCPL